MKVIDKKISTLIQAEYNPRKLSDKQFGELRDSLNRFGFVDPVLVNTNKDRKNIIIGGHQRTKVWESMGNDTVPVVELDLTLDQEKELNVRLNKSGGDFDVEMLKEHFDTELLVDWGFESYQFEEPEKVDLDEFFEEQTPDKEPKEETKKIILEYKEEDYDLVIKAFSDLGGTKEDTVFKFLGL